MTATFRALASRAAAVLVVTAALTASAGAQTPTPYGTNLVTNGDAEAEAGAPDNSTIVKPSAWTTTGQFTAVKYGASGGFPDASSPGPSDRGKNLFEGGNVARSTATQTISLADRRADIFSGGVHYAFSAWLGGYASQKDNALVSVTFRNAAGKLLFGAALGPVTAAQRHNITGLLQRKSTGIVPKNAATATISVIFTREAGEYNDGSADNISFVLTKP